jgi:PEP-CTERM motif
MKSKLSGVTAALALTALRFMLIALLGVLVSPSYAAVIDVSSASALGANDSIGWGQINLPAGQAVQVYTSPQSVVSTNENAATVSVADDNVFVRVDQAPGGDYYGNFPPGMQLINTCGNCPSVGSFEAFVINFNQPVYGGGAQVGAGSYGPYNAIVMAFSGAHLLGTYSVAGTTTTDGLNNPAPFVGLLSNSPSITRLVFFADSASVRPGTLSPDQTALGTVSLNVRVNPAVPEPSTWAMMLIGFAGLGFAFRQPRRKVSFA